MSNSCAKESPQKLDNHLFSLETLCTYPSYSVSPTSFCLTYLQMTADASFEKISVRSGFFEKAGGITLFGRNPKRKRTHFFRARGQATIMIALIMVTFLSLFTFSVNVGLLVNAKINLQNAADLAAYAGAATQARLLNHIGFLNYEMRRQYKKFLFRYYVVGTMSQTSFFSDEEEGRETRSWKPGKGDSYGVPTVCVIFNHNDNYCRIKNLAQVPQVPINPLDAISETLRGQLQAFEQIRQENCAAIQATNELLLGFWLYNADPDLKSLLEELTSTSAADFFPNVVQTIRGLSAGVGLIPRQMLLFNRIKTLEYYVNFPPQRSVNLEKANQLSSEGDSAARERTLQAFFSAYYTLGEHTFDGSSFQLDELIPGGRPDSSYGEIANLLELTPIRTSFEAWYTRFQDIKPGGSKAGDAKECQGAPDKFKVRNIPVGVFKEPKILTYYALRLKAKARLMFWPFQEIPLKAYAAAQPFGSRIGPAIEETNDTKPFTNPAGKDHPACGGDCFGTPNLPVTADDSNSQGWYRPKTELAFYSELAGATGSSQGEFNVVTPTDMERAYHAAMVPNPSEVGQYLIPNDVGTSPNDQLHLNGGDPFMAHFANSSRSYALWAPLRSPDSLTAQSTLEDEIRQLIQSGTFVDAPAQLKTALGVAIPRYISQRLRSAEGGENGETVNIVRITNPLEGRPGLSDTINLPAEIFARNVGQIRTSWADVRHGEFKQRGRTGYSVKFVSFKTLRSPRDVTSNGRTIWTNFPDLDVDAEGDVPNLRH